MSAHATIVNSLDPAAAVAAMPDTTPKHTFKIPHTRQGIVDTDPKTITIKPLTMEQEIQGNRLFSASGDAWPKVAMALYAVDGRPLNWLQRENEVALQRMSPKCRDFVSEAYKAVHVANQKETDDFLASATLEL